MMYRFLILAALLVSTRANSQITNLSVQSRIGYDCTQEPVGGAEPLRGSCLYEQTLSYRQNKRVFKTGRLYDLRLFHAYKGGFLPNSVRDSVHNKRLFLRRKLPVGELEALLFPILQLKRDSVMVFDVADFSKNAELLAFCKDSAATVVNKLKADFHLFGMSSVMRDLVVSFDSNGVRYTLTRDHSNHFWRLRYSSGDTEITRRFIHTGLDAFFTRKFAKRFDGRFLTDNHLLEHRLKVWLKIEEEHY